ncbi:AMP-binding protein [uncultured Sneathiella sp.]|uniref:AMP-binding protein n=1 Tax=uncultured Sneathiella sp. TaxID=879315 RepID=UPI0030ECCB84|tara:strand:- start:6819 stop:8462 length:1644 start_codon:yes stop_codon:yes gene_type:complete
MKRLRSLGIPLEDFTMGSIIRHKAEKNGDKVFLRFEGREYSYKEFHEISNRLGRALSELGVEPGQHVAFMMDNKPEQLFLYFALGKIGAVSVPVNTAAKGELLAYYLNQSDSVVLISDSGLVERFRAVQDQCEAIGKVIILDEQGAIDPAKMPQLNAEIIDYRNLLEAPADDLPEGVVRNRDISMLLYTSGTTGPSKGNMVPHGRTIGGAIDHVEYFGFGPDDVLYTCLPLFHGNALNTSAIPALMADATLVISRRFSASNFWDEIRNYDVTAFSLLGAMVNILWAQPPSPRDRENKARLCMMVPVPDFAREFEERFGLKVTSVYALSDYGFITFLSPEHPDEKWRSAGQPRSGMTVSIMDDDDNPLPAGTPGEICVRCDVPWITARGYYKMPQATVDTNRNQWFHTGDRGYLDEDGYIYFVDRKKDAIRRRGENISSYEVEQIILGHPAVEDVAAYAVNSEMSEDEVMVSVTCKDGKALDPAELVRYCADNMAYFMVPRFVEIVSELPRTMTEKIEKYKLKQSAQERLSEIWDREAEGIVVNRHTN